MRDSWVGRVVVVIVLILSFLSLSSIVFAACNDATIYDSRYRVYVDTDGTPDCAGTLQLVADYTNTVDLTSSIGGTLFSNDFADCDWATEGYQGRVCTLYSFNKIICPADDAVCATPAYENSGYYDTGIDLDFDSSEVDCTCAGYTYMNPNGELADFVGSNYYCCGDDGTSDDFYGFSGNVTTDEIVLYGNCVDGVASTISVRGNGYSSGTTCYYGDSYCSFTEGNDGDTCTLACSGEGTVCCPVAGTCRHSVSCNDADNAEDGCTYEDTADLDYSQECCEATTGGCTGSGNNWLTYGEGTNSGCCGDDGTSDDFEQVFGAGRSACIDGSVVTDGTVFDTNFIVSDGQVYSCNSPSTYDFDTDYDDTTCLPVESLYCLSTNTWGARPASCDFCSETDPSLYQYKITAGGTEVRGWTNTEFGYGTESTKYVDIGTEANPPSWICTAEGQVQYLFRALTAETIGADPPAVCDTPVWETSVAYDASGYTIDWDNDETDCNCYLGSGNYFGGQCCGDDQDSTDTFNGDASNGCCCYDVNGHVKQIGTGDDEICWDSNNYWCIDGTYCSASSGVVRDPSQSTSTSGKLILSGDDISCGCDSSGVICDTNDQSSLMNGICVSNLCQESGLVAKSGAIYYSACASGRVCDDEISDSPSNYYGFFQTGICAGTSCCLSLINSGETSSVDWTDGDESCSCASGGEVCDLTTSTGPSPEGLCVANICHTGLTVLDTGVYYNTCSGHGGSQCDSSVSDGAFTPGDNRCDGSDSVCRLCDFVTGKDSENLCETDCGADASSDEKSSSACDGSLGYIDSNCVYYSEADDNSETCSCVIGAGYWSLGGEVSATTCCDDSGDNRIIESGNSDAPLGYDDGITTCCSDSTDCTYDDTCYADLSTSSSSIPNKAYCNSGTWDGGDDSSTACTAITGNSANWLSLGIGENCCGDDSTENFEQALSAGRSACLGGTVIGDKVTYLTNFLVSDGQVYSCKSPSTYTFDDDYNEYTCTTVEGLYCEDDGTWDVLIPIYCPVPCSSGSECGSGLCVEGLCRFECNATYNADACSDDSNNYGADGICSRIDGTWECDETEASFYLNDYWNDCDKTSYGSGCDGGSLAGGYSVEGVCAGTNHDTCYTQFISDISSSVTLSSILGVESVVCASENNGYYCDDVSDGSWIPGDQRCDGTDTACRTCDLVTGEDSEGLCELACGADISSDELSANACDGSSGYIDANCNYYTDGDSNTETCSCKEGSGYWALGGETSATTCCDDGGENRITEIEGTDAPSGYNDGITTCCSDTTDCTYDDTCYSNLATSSASIPNKAYCNSGVWDGGDAGSTQCTAIVGSGSWSLGGNIASTTCCGDDSGENIITEGGNTDSPSGYNDGITTCCSDTTDCTYDDTCYADLSTSSVSIPNKAYCNAGTWDGGDDSSTACTAIVGSGSWSLGGNIASTTCCGDDVGENIIIETEDTDAPLGYNDGITTCCSNSTDCTYDDTCYSDLSTSSASIPNKAYCNSGVWDGGDAGITQCTAIVGSGFWSLGGNIASTTCCGDDDNENMIIESGAVDIPLGYNDSITTCCSNSTDCTYDDTCYPIFSIVGVHPDEVYCNSGIWEGGDDSSLTCTAIVGSGSWSLGGEISQTDCCGDDNNENIIVESGNSDVPLDYNDGITTCCSNSTDCTYNDTCYSDTDVSIFSIPYRAYCNNGTWDGGDDSSTACTAITGNSSNWLSDGVTQNCCGDDSTDDDFEQTSGSGRSACIDGIVRADGWTSGSLLVDDGQIYSCNSFGTYDFDTDYTFSTCTAVNGYYCNSDNTWKTTLPNGCGCSMGDECIDNLCIEGICRASCDGYTFVENACSDGSFAYDTLFAGICKYDSSSLSYYCEDRPPQITLNAPIEDYYNDTFSPIIVNFNCSAIDKELKNLSFYITNSSNSDFAFYDNCFVNGTSGNCVLNLSLGNGIYTWNCMGEDNLNQTAFALSNRTVTIDYYPCNTGLDCAERTCIEGLCKDSCSEAYDGMNCSDNGLSYLSSGMCTRINSTSWKCDTYEAAHYNGNYWNDCYDVPEANECTSGSLALGYFKDGVCAGSICCVDNYIDINNDKLFNDGDSACTSCSSSYFMSACSNNIDTSWDGVCFDNGAGYDCVNYTTDCIFISSNMISGICLGSTLEESYGEYSDIYNSTINRSSLYHMITNNTIFLDSVVRSSTINLSIVDNAIINDSHFFNSKIYNSEICSGIFGRDVTIVDNILTTGKITFNDIDYYAPTPMSLICAGSSVQSKGTLSIDKEVVNDSSSLKILYDSNNIIGYNVSLNASLIGAGNIYMLDNGIFPDEIKQDGIYTAEVNVSTSLVTGSRTLTATIISIDDVWQLEQSVYVDNTLPEGSLSLMSSDGSDVESLSATIIATIEFDDNYGVAGCRFGNENISDLDNHDFESCKAENIWGLDNSDGLKTVFLEILDSAGNRKIYSDTIILNKTVLQDSTPPTSPVVIDEGLYTNSIDTLYFDWYNSSDRENGLLFLPLEYNLKLWNGSEYIYELNGTTDTEITITDLNLSEGGNYSLNVTAENFAGLESSVASSDGIIVDITAPSLTTIISSVTSTNWSMTDTITFNFSATDGLSGIESYSYSFDIDDSTLPDDISEKKSSETFYNLGDGIYYLKVKALDRAGNIGNISEKVFRIDNTAPTIPQIYEKELFITETANENLTFRWMASKDISGIDDYWLQISSDSEFENLVYDNVVGNVTSYKFSPSESGKYYARVRSKNGVGLWSLYSDILKGDLDVYPPEITVVKPRGKVASLYPVLVLETNEKATCSYRNATGSYKLFDITDSTHHEVILSLDNGFKSYYVECLDLVGNSAESSVGFTVDTSLVPDTLTIAENSKDSFYSEEIIKINFTLEDNGVGVGEFELENLEVLIDSTVQDSDEVSFSDIGKGVYVLAMNAPIENDGVSTHTLQIKSKMPVLTDSLEITINKLDVTTYCKNSENEEEECVPKSKSTNGDFIVPEDTYVDSPMLTSQKVDGTNHFVVSTLRYKTIVLRIRAPQSLSTGVYYFDIRNVGTDSFGRKVVELTFIEDPDEIDESSVWIIE